MAFIARRLRLGKWKYHKGFDLEGNSYFEFPNRLAKDPHDPRAMKRTVEYRLEKPMYAYQGNELPVQWSAWMRRTRQLPPSLEELQEDQVRAVKLQQNVERLKLEYAAEKERLTATHQLPTPSVSLPESSTSPASQQHLQHDIATSIEPDAQIGESDQAAQHQKHQAAEESVRKQPLGQAPSPDAQRPGAQALKRQVKTAENPDASWQPEAATPTPKRRG